jgi:hypothetical protein
MWSKIARGKMDEEVAHHVKGGARVETEKHAPTEHAATSS